MSNALAVIVLLVNVAFSTFILVKGSRITKRGVTWNPGNNWALGCDFPGNDLSDQQVPSEQCGGRCAATTGCTHFSWTLFNGGTCWMKRGDIQKSNAIVTTDQSVVCGVISTSSNSIEWQSGSWALGCDFPGNDLSSRQTSGEECGETCSSTTGCTHFTWTSFNGGTCWLKQGNAQKSDAVAKADKSIVCGLVGGGGDNFQVLNGVRATRHGAVNDKGGSCALPEGSYAVTTPVAVGDIAALQYLKYRPGMCGHVLTVNCGHGLLDIIVVNSNLGNGLDLYGSSWEKATGGQPPGEAYCSVQLTSKNPFSFDGPRCYYDPGSEKYNDYFHLLGVFNSNGRVVQSASLDEATGSFNGASSYFAFHSGSPVSQMATVVFTFEDGSTFRTLLKDCVRENDKHGWT